jgi:hypothetical protein
VAQRSFDVHFARKRRAIMEYEDKAWKTLDRMHQFYLAKVKFAAPYTKTLIDNEGIDIVHEERTDVEENPDSPFKRFKLEPERTATLRTRSRVFYWG